MYMLAYWTCLLLAVDHVQTIEMYLDPTFATFYEAEDLCKQRGMQLAIFNSLAEYEEANAYMNSQSPVLNEVWIGYQKDVTTAQFQWINGKPIQFTTPWTPSGADYTGTDCCVRLSFRNGVYLFADCSCGKPFAFLCTGKEEVTTTDTTTYTVKTTKIFSTPSDAMDITETTSITTKKANSTPATGRCNIISYNGIIVGAGCMCQCGKETCMTNYKNYTFEELKTILAPITEQLRKDLVVDKRRLSAYIYRHKTRKDNRPSARYLGYVGVTFLVAVCVLIILADVSSWYTKGYSKARKIR